jgi:hypothetical protein
MYGDATKVRAGGPSQFIPPPGETAARLARRYLPPGLRFRLRLLQADLGNFFFVQHRNVDGFVVTAKNGGSHWLKFMLSVGIAHRHGLPPPKFSTGPQAEDIIGHPARKRRYPDMPQICTTHTIPSALQRHVPKFLVRRPPIVVVVRQIEPAMLSSYRKWRGHYETLSPTPLDDFARGDPGGRRFVADAWWYVHFFNRWGAWAAADPDRILIVRYEDLVADTNAWLARIAAHLRLHFDPAAMRAALAFAGKEAMRARQDPDAGELIVPHLEAAPIAFSAGNLDAIHAILRRYLRHDFGYAAQQAEAPQRPAAKTFGS